LVPEHSSSKNKDNILTYKEHAFSISHLFWVRDRSPSEDKLIFYFKQKERIENAENEIY